MDHLSYTTTISCANMTVDPTLLQVTLHTIYSLGVQDSSAIVHIKG